MREVSLLLGCWIYAVGCTLLAWRQPWLLFVLLGAGSAVLVLSRPTRRWLTLWIVATAAGLLTEYWLSARLRMWVYAMPTWSGLPVWQLWGYGASMVIFVRLAEWITGRLNALLAVYPNVYRSLIGVGAALALGYGTFVIYVVSPVFGRTYLVLGLIIAACRPRGKDVVLFWVAMVLGLMAEASCIAAGVFAYTFPHFTQWGIPISLPLAWGELAVLICRLSEWMAGYRGAASNEAMNC